MQAETVTRILIPEWSEEETVATPNTLILERQIPSFTEETAEFGDEDWCWSLAYRCLEYEAMFAADEMARKQVEFSLQRLQKLDARK